MDETSTDFLRFLLLSISSYDVGVFGQLLLDELFSPNNYFLTVYLYFPPRLHFERTARRSPWGIPADQASDRCACHCRPRMTPCAHHRPAHTARTWAQPYPNLGMVLNEFAAVFAPVGWNGIKLRYSVWIVILNFLVSQPSVPACACVKGHAGRCQHIMRA